jgi:hypothetical protein
VEKGQLVIGGISFNPPSTGDIFSCSTRPFAWGANAQANCIIPRLAAAFTRGTLPTSGATPDLAGSATFHKAPVTNLYARDVHQQLLDAKVHAIPYDDVVAGGGPDQCGAVHYGWPEPLPIAVGGEWGKGRSGLLDYQLLRGGLYNAGRTVGNLGKHFNQKHLSKVKKEERVKYNICKILLRHKMYLQRHAFQIHGTVSKVG